jgi:hypothetical protein
VSAEPRTRFSRQNTGAGYRDPGLASDRATPGGGLWVPTQSRQTVCDRCANRSDLVSLVDLVAPFPCAQTSPAVTSQHGSIG